MKIRRTRSTIAVVGACFMHTAYDSGAEVAVADWRTFESRLTKLETENADLRAQLDDAVTQDDLAGYATVDQCGACVQPTDIAAFVTKSRATVATSRRPLPHAGRRRREVRDPDLAAALKSSLPDFTTFALGADPAVTVSWDQESRSRC